MFTMQILGIGRTLIAAGRSRPGETWEETLQRLYQQTLPPGEPPRRVIYMTYHQAETGGPTNMVVIGSDYPLTETQDPPVFITITHPNSDWAFA